MTLYCSISSYAKLFAPTGSFKWDSCDHCTVGYKVHVSSDSHSWLLVSLSRQLASAGNDGRDVQRERSQTVCHRWTVSHPWWKDFVFKHIIHLRFQTTTTDSFRLKPLLAVSMRDSERTVVTLHTLQAAVHLLKEHTVPAPVLITLLNIVPQVLHRQRGHDCSSRLGDVQVWPGHGAAGLMDHAKVEHLLPNFFFLYCLTTASTLKVHRQSLKSKNK